ncbi:hypothetical protein SAMN00790413_05948 [Deinococcus hopiensis KR-140]|uniref:Uncharacterized protein n=1 Tax=Deinococcus hopiensis KR-140 TaxID=695939 RepID=A0A1W1VVN1_9DEIO|nr:hypothetical protein SAMN00790413_05948 [Deinococcus hopiensis KR-140]
MIPAAEDSQPVRIRTFSWQGPLFGSHPVSGLDSLRAMDRSELPVPSVMAALGSDDVPPEAERGRVTFFLDPQEYHNPIGSVHGSVFATLLPFGNGLQRAFRPCGGSGIHDAGVQGGLRPCVSGGDEAGPLCRPGPLHKTAA